ncbi:hypothetical protein S7711_04101 [Stachybotrys chartarum IBT 7711]|uniref:Triosephosphate isomerase n=1 Tax=Stachybotrys chartarum (strain CBS 109288 / IBT 7711) TaxID=1280523 RepID=A0A084AR57_STACB|nr:hypothetical protein S7711_04101 [Stachybotrys chartarum IBT 7711]
MAGTRGAESFFHQRINASTVIIRASITTLKRRSPQVATFLAMASSGSRRLIGLSTKMYFSLARSRDFTSSLVSQLGSVPSHALSRIDVFILPDFIALPTTVSQLRASDSPASTIIWPGAQDCHWEDQGAFTGQVSASVLQEAGARIVMVGHAERRRLFGEDDILVAKKAAAVTRNGMVPLVCVGEQTRAGEESSDSGDGTAAAVRQCAVQVDTVLETLPATTEVILAYEPVWAIGATQPAGVEHILSVVEGIRTLESVRSRSGVTRIVYGGSAGPGLFARLKSGLDGLFLARFGHDPVQFVRTIREVAEA